MAEKCMKRSLTSLAVKKMQINDSNKMMGNTEHPQRRELLEPMPFGENTK
jgi:hypothetical protein